MIANPRLLMEFKSYSVTADLTDDRITICVSMIMDCLSHISEESPRTDCFESLINTFLCYLNEALFLRGNFSDTEHSRRIREISVKNGGTIHIDDIAFLQNDIL